MKRPRTAQLLTVSALITAFVVGPVPVAVAAPQPTPAKTEPAAETEPADDSKAESDAPEPEPEPTSPTEGEGAEPTSESDPAGTEATPAEPEPEPEPEPEAEPTPAAVTVQPVEVSIGPAAGKSAGDVPPQESLVDGRRRRADERMLLRASGLSFGIAAVALVPMIVGFQQANVARRERSTLNAGDPEAANLENREQQMTTLGIAGGVVAGAQLVTGAVLLGLALRRPANERHAVAPAIGRGQLGLVWRARF